MSIFEQSKIRGYKFLDRCITLSNYIITFYIEDMVSAKTMLDEIEAFILGLNEVYILPKKIGGTNGHNKSMEI